MIAAVIRLINVVALMLCVAWLTDSTSWEPLVVTLTLFATLVGQELAVARSNRENPDKQLFEELLNDLPSEGCISFIENHDFHAAFRLSNLDRIYDFRRKWSKPEREFGSWTLDRRRRKLLEAIEEFVSLIGQHTSPATAHTNSLSPALQRNKPQEFAKIGDEINDAADLVVDRHKKLIRTGRKKLRV